MVEKKKEFHGLIIVENGKPYIKKEITLTQKEFEYRTLVIASWGEIIEALRQRLAECETHASKMIMEDKVIHIDNFGIQFSDGSRYNYSAITAMLDLMDWTAHKTNDYCTLSDLENLTAQQLNQLKKALVVYKKSWDISISIIEEFEHKPCV